MRMKVPFSNLILFAGIVDFGNVCKTGTRTTQSNLKNKHRWDTENDNFEEDGKQTSSKPSYGFKNQYTAVVSSDDPPPVAAAAPLIDPNPPPAAASPVLHPVFIDTIKNQIRHPIAKACKDVKWYNGEPLKLVVKYSPRADFEHDFEVCDTEAYLVKLGGYDRMTNVVRTKASCFVDIKNEVREGNNFQIILQPESKYYEYYGTGKPLVHFLYQREPSDNVGLIRLSEPVFLTRFIVPGCERPSFNPAWVNKHATEFSTNLDYTDNSA